MPATEQTWRDSKILHVVFGVSSLAMLGTTIWMLAADHRREWKDYQRKFQHIEAWTTQARISQQESDQYEKDKSEARAAWEATRRDVPDRALIEQFEQVVDRDAERRGVKEPDFRNTIDKDYETLAQAEPDQRPEARERLRGDLARYVNEARFNEEKLATEKKFKAAELEVVRSQYELGVGNELPHGTLLRMQEKVDSQMNVVGEATDEVQAATIHRKTLEAILGEVTAKEIEAKKTLDDMEGQVVQLQKALYERENHVMKEVTELPILDAFGRPIKIEQIWLPKLTINYNFGAVGDIARFDRCITCHQAIDKTAPGSAIEPGYPEQKLTTLAMDTPTERPALLQDRPKEPAKLQEMYDKVIEETYGLQLAQHG
ncbi:MAG TPA: hypothetical protein VHV08_12945, partial [Pirellulales bacterium]|nr:hypothetical protein [Pirellulales bacterium]